MSCTANYSFPITEVKMLPNVISTGNKNCLKYIMYSLKNECVFLNAKNISSLLKIINT